MFLRAYLQDRPIEVLKKLRDRFPHDVGLIMPASKGSNDKKTWTIVGLVTEAKQKDIASFAEQNFEYKIVDIFLEDLDALKVANPSAYIVTKNFQKNVSIKLDGAVFKIRPEQDPQGFETMARFICERTTMKS